MLTYQQWDAIADSYIPGLCIFSVASLAYQYKQRRSPVNTLYYLAILLLGVAQVYALMWMDQKLKLWQNFASDYSTHTALSLWFGLWLISFLRWWKKEGSASKGSTIEDSMRENSANGDSANGDSTNADSTLENQTAQKGAAYVIGLSWCLYLVLMRFQNYHTWPDMSTTAFAILPLSIALILIQHSLQRR